MSDRKVTYFLLGQRLLHVAQFVVPALCPAQITLHTNPPRQNFPVLSAHDAYLTP
ncbi:MAG TPA: hypothetical protein VIF39_08980 [Hyphomicrobium sp.]